jgi:hypothetical protein
MQVAWRTIRQIAAEGWRNGRTELWILVIYKVLSIAVFSIIVLQVAILGFSFLIPTPSQSGKQ